MVCCLHLRRVVQIVTARSEAIGTSAGSLDRTSRRRNRCEFANCCTPARPLAKTSKSNDRMRAMATVCNRHNTLTLTATETKKKKKTKALLTYILYLSVLLCATSLFLSVKALSFDLQRYTAIAILSLYIYK